MSELPDDVYAEVTRIQEQGNACLEAGDYDSAYAFYRDAWSKLPEPANKWSAGLWLIAAMGDTKFQSGDFKTANELFRQAAEFYEGFGNPFVHLRLGQTAHELGDQVRATDELVRAFALAGKEIFEAEDQKYYLFLQTRVDPPVFNGVAKWP